MTASSIHPNRALGHQSYVVQSLGDGSALAQPWPGMSGRAALIARSLSVMLLSTWLAFVSPHLAVLLAFAVPFWIAAELENIQAKRQRVSTPKAFRISFVSRF
jgi:hypothetical protein